MMTAGVTSTSLAVAAVLWYAYTAAVAVALPPCVYEGHLKTERDWLGYLANVSVMTTGRMTYHFSYPADRCCPNVLFYLEDQASVINARMNCWQKEAVLRPENDQVLRLTPRFTWSGCHLAHPNGVATYECAGGRSFATLTPGGDRPTTWFVAVSNCATLAGLDLRYRLEVFGHIGDCATTRTYGVVTTTTPAVEPPAPVAAAVRPNGHAAAAEIDDNACVIEGTLNETVNWYGFLANFSLLAGGGFRFKLSYPAAMQVQSVILYDARDVAKLRAGQNCWQKYGIVASPRVADQILDLSYRSSWNGCATRNATADGAPAVLVCTGQRRYDAPRNVFVAVSNCRGRPPALRLNYSFVVSGYEGDLCSAGGDVRRHWSRLVDVITVVIVVVFVLRVSNFTDDDDHRR